LRLSKEREKPLEFRLVRLATVFTNLKRFDVFDLGGLIRVIPVRKLRAETFCQSAVSPAQIIAHFALTFLLFFRIAWQQISRAIRATLVELGNDQAQRVEFLLDDLVNGNQDVRLKWVRLPEPVGIEE